MEDSQQVIDNLQQLFSRPIGDWTDKTTGKQLLQKADEYLQHIEGLLGHQNAIVQNLRTQEADLLREVAQRRMAAHQADSNTHEGGDAPGDRDRGTRPDGPEAAPLTPPAVPIEPPTTPPGPTPDARASAALDVADVFGQVLSEFQRQTRFELRRKLQTGRFGTGYVALDRDSGREVVVKFPAHDAWFARFEECAAALRWEAEALAAIHAAIQGADGTGSARVVALIEHGALHIDSWEQPVPWIAQTFARGHRLSEPGTLPMRDQQEATALRILAQVTGLALRLYAAGWAHLDLKPDCLFWDSASQMVEVIDWNRASHNPDPASIESEFAAIQRLVTSVLVGPRFESNDSETMTRSLFVAFRGLPLSRGTRLLLQQLLDPTPGPTALRSVADLHQALVELVSYWDNPLQTLPQLDSGSAQASSQLLTRLAIEVQRAPETSLVAVQRRDWYRQTLLAVEKAVQSELGVWITINEAMRPGFGRIEQMWRWLVDVWPLSWIVPLSRAWFSSQPRASDRELALLNQALVHRRWTELDLMLQQQLNSAPPPVQAHLRQIRAVIDAYRALDQVELLLRESPPNYVGALNRLVPARDTLPQELRVAELAAQIDAGIQSGTQITRLLGELADLLRQPPSQALQRGIWEVLQQLQQLGVTDQRYLSQQQTIMVIDQAARAYADAMDQLDGQQWGAAHATLSMWRDQPQLRAAAPDLSARLTALCDSIPREAALSELSSLSAQIQRALAQAEFTEAESYAAQAIELAEAHAAIVPDAARRIRELAATIQPVCQRWGALQESRYDQAALIKLPEGPAAGLHQLLADLENLTAQGEQLVQATTLVQAHASYALIAQATGARERPAAAQQLWERLRQRARQQLEHALIEALSRPTPDAAVLASADAALHQLSTERHDQLGQIAAMLKQHQQQDSIEWLGTGLREELKRLATAQSALITNVTALHGQTTAQIESIRQELAAQFDKQQVGQAGGAPPAIAPAEPAAPPAEPVRLASPAQPDREPHAQPPSIVAGQPAPSTSEHADLAGPGPHPVRRVRNVLGIGAVLLLVAVLLLIGLRPWLFSSSVGAELLPQPTVAPSSAAFTAANPAAASLTAQAASPVASLAPPPASPASPVATAAALSIPLPDSAAARLAPTTLSIPVPDSTDARLARNADVDVTVSVPPRDAWNQPWTLRAPGIGSVTTIVVVVAGQRLEPELTAQPDADSITIRLPPNLLNALPSFSEPPTIELQAGRGFKPVSVNFSEMAITVEGIQLVAAQFPNELQRRGAYLWVDPNKRAVPQDTVKPGDLGPNVLSYVLLNDGDNVKVLKNDGTFYWVEVISNQADNDSTLVLGKQGWVRRQFIEK